MLKQHRLFSAVPPGVVPASLRRHVAANARRARAARRATTAVVAAAAALAVAVPASAQTWNGTTGNWNVAGNWTPSAVPTSGTTTSLTFGGTTGYTTTDDVGAASSTFTAGALTFNNPAGVTVAFSGTTRTLTLATGTSAGTPNATLTQLAAGPVAINGTLLLLDTGGGSTATTATADFTGTGTGDLSITEVRWNVNNSPTARFSGSYSTTVGSWYKQQGNKTITNNTVAGKTLTIGGIALATGNANNQLTINGTGDTVVSGPISFTNQGAGTNSGVLVYSGTGSLTLSGSNTFGTVGGSVTSGGAITVNSGTLNVSNVAGANNNLGNGTSAIALGSAAGATFNYTGSSTTFTRGFTIGGAGGGRINAAAAGQTLTLDTAGVTGTAGTLTVGGAGDVVVNPAVTLGTGGLTKLDAGTLTLNGAVTYSGPTVVSGGSLAFGPAATLGTTNAFTVAPGATLTLPTAGVSLTTGGAFTAGRTSGSGTDVTGNVSIGGGATLTVGGNGAAGTFALAGNLSLAAGSAVRFDLSNVTTPGGGVNDLVAATGSLTLPTGTDTVAVNLTGLNGPLAVGSYTLFTYGSLAGGGAANLAAPTGLAAGRSTYTYDTSEAGKLKLVVGGGAANLTWVGNGSTNPWDNSTAGVFTGASPDKFFDGDVVNFTEAAAAGNRTVTLAGGLAPFAANVSGAGSYTFAGTGSIVGTATLTKTGAGTLTVATANGYTGATTVSGGTLVVADTSALGAAATGTTVAAGAQVKIAGGINTPEPITINGTGIGGTGALQSGGGGANAVSGTVTVQSDAAISNPDPAVFTLDVPAGTAVLGGGANLTVVAGGDVAINGAVALGTGTLTKIGGGKLTLGGTAASTGAGSYVVTAGTVELNKTAGVTAVPGGLVLGDGTTPVTAKLLAANQIADAAAVTVNAGSTFDLNGNAETVAAVAGTGTVTSSTPAVLSITAGTTAALLTGPLSLTKANGGTLAVTNAGNTFTGTLQVNNGILEVASLADAGAGSQGTGTIKILNGTNAGAVLRYLGPARTISRAIDVFATGTGAGTAGLESSGTGPLTWTGDVSLSASGAAKSFALQGTNAGDNVFAGKVTNGAGTLSLVKDGPGTWSVTNAANDFTGNVTVNDGTLRIANAGALGTGTKTVSIANATYPSLVLDGSAGNIVLPAGIGFTASNDGTGGRPGAIVNLAGDNVINGPVALVNGNAGNGRLTVTAGTLTVAGAVNANGATGVRTLLIGGAGNGTVSGVVADGVTGANTRVVSVQKDGAGTWSLTGANTYTGSVSVQAGTLRIAAVADPATAQPLGIATGAVTLGTATTAGTLEYAGTAAGTLARPLTVNGAGGGVVRNSGGQPLTLSAAITTSGRPLTLTGGAFDVTGVVAGAAAGSTLNVDAATVSLSAANTYNGPTNVLGGGVLRNAVANALPAATTVVVGGAVGNTGGTYDLNGFAQAVSAIGDAGTGQRVITNNAASAAATLTVTGTGTFGGTLKDGPTATLALAKTTGGTLTLSGPNTYSGGTTISAGAVVVAAGGSLGTGPVTLGGTGTLAGVGPIAGPVQVAGGTVGPGVAVGTLTLAGGVAFTGGALSVDLNGLAPGTGHDQLVVSAGNASLGAGVTTLTGTSGFAPSAGDRLWVLSNTGSGTTSGYFLDAGGTPLQASGSLLFVGSQQFAVYYGADAGTNALTGGNDVVLVATGVPEPSAAVAGLGLAAAGLLGRRRRRSRR